MKKMDDFQFWLQKRWSVENIVTGKTIRCCRVDKSAGYRLYQKCRKIYQFQIPGWKTGRYFLFRAAVSGRQGNDRAVSELLRYQLYWVEISMCCLLAILN